MTFHYLDASAWVKRYYQERGSTWVQRLFRDNQTLGCASLGLIEVVATLARKRKAGAIDRSHFERKAKEVKEDWDRFVKVHLTGETVELAKSLAGDLALRGADAVHLASALLIRRRLADEDDRLIFVTSDSELKEAA